MKKQGFFRRSLRKLKNRGTTKMVEVEPAEPETPVTVISAPESQEFTIDFTISKFSSFKDKKASIYSDKIFFWKSSWRVSVHPMEETEVKGEKIKAVGVFLHVDLVDAKETCKGYHVVCDLRALGITAHNTTPKSGGFIHIENDFIKSGHGRGAKRFLLHSELWGPNTSLVLPNDTLKIRAEIKATLLRTAAVAVQATALATTTRENSLGEKYRKLCDSSFGRDFLLVSDDGTERSVHKAILDNNSPIVHSMFESNLEECRAGRCVMSDVSTVILDEMIRFMYYGTVEDMKTNATGLPKAADKYDMNDLKDQCGEALVVKLGMENVVEMVILGNTLNSTIVKKAAVEFLSSNYEEASKDGKIAQLFEADPVLIKDLLDVAMKE